MMRMIWRAKLVKNRWSIISSLLLSELISIILGTRVIAQTIDPEIDQLRQRLEELESILLRQQSEIEALRSQLEKQQTSIEDDSQLTQSNNDSYNTIPSSDTANSLSNKPFGRFPDDAIVTKGDFKGSINIPGTNASVKLGGFVRLNAIYDIDNLGFEELVSNRTIPLDGSSEDKSNQTRFHVRNTRLNVDVRQETKLGDFRTFIEADFFGDGDELKSNYQFRLRHAIAQLGNLYVGQWWSSFNDIEALPEVSDDGGPLGAPNLRQPGIRWSQTFDSGIRYTIALENPSGDLSDSSSDNLASESFPDLIGYVNLDRSWGRLRLAGILRELETKNDQKFVGGVNFSGRIPLTFLGGKRQSSLCGTNR